MFSEVWATSQPWDKSFVELGLLLIAVVAMREGSRRRRFRFNDASDKTASDNLEYQGRTTSAFERPQTTPRTLLPRVFVGVALVLIVIGIVGVIVN
jgi:hypothetical protein